MKWASRAWRIKYYLTSNRGSFLQMQYGFYRYALQIHCGFFCVIGRTFTKNSGKLKRGTWLFRASWMKVIKISWPYEIIQVSLFLLTGGPEIANTKAVTRIDIWLARLTALMQSYDISSHYEILRKIQGRFSCWSY